MTRGANLRGTRRASTPSRRVPAGVPATVGRTIAVLRALCSGRRTVAELARTADVPLSAAYRWLDYMVDAGVPIESEPSAAPRAPLVYWIDSAALRLHLRSGS